MVLGNSNGSNKGKKYFIRKHASKDMITDESQNKANDFMMWFDHNHNILKSGLINHNIYDIDIFHDTYLKMHEVILYANLTVKNYTTYFNRAYYTNMVQNQMVENRYIKHFDFSCMHKSEKNNIHVFEDEYSSVVSEVLTKAKEILGKEDFIIFSDFLNWKIQQPGLNGGSMVEYSKQAGLNGYVLRRIFSKAKKYLQSDIQLQKRLNQLYSLI